MNDEKVITQDAVQKLDVVNKNGVFYVDFESCLHSFDVINRNSRMYEASNIEECLILCKKH